MDPLELSNVEAAFRAAALGPPPGAETEPARPTVNDYLAATVDLEPWGVKKPDGIDA